MGSTRHDPIALDASPGSFVRHAVAALAVAGLALAVTAASGIDGRVPTPSSFLQIKIGGDGVLADYTQIVSYWRALDALSDRIEVQELGSTTMGHPYIVAVVTSPENHARLEQYREINNRLYDARKTSEEDARRLVAEGKTIVAMQMGIHSTEVGAPQVSMELGYRFATEDTPRMRQVLKNTIVILSPSHNPDGTEMVAEWNRKMAGTRFEGSSPPALYQRYVGHDNNRDWYMFTQKESQITVEKIWNYWHPQISYDLHQMGDDGARIFVPPYVDPVDPNVDPILRGEINALGSAMAAHLLGEGKDGVVFHALYDLWTPARAYVNYHGGVRVLSEVASAKLASPITIAFDRLGRGIGYDAREVSWNFPRPWRGGTWRLRDIMDYEHTASAALLDHAATYRERWLANFYRVSRNAIGRIQPETGAEKPFAIVVSADQADPVAAFKMLWVLQFGEVEVRRARREFVADGRRYAAGSHVILMAQPASAFAKTLTEVQKYPDLRQYPGGPPQRPYDVTAYTLPLLMGVETLSVRQPFEADLDLVAAPIVPPAGKVAGRATKAYLFGHDNAGLLAALRLLASAVHVRWAPATVTAGNRRFPAGTFVVPVDGQPGVHEAVSSAAAALPLTVHAADDVLPPATPLRLPRVGLYRSFDSSMDEGWTRWIFEQWGMPYVSLVNQDIRAAALASRFDVIVLPDQEPSAIIDGLRPGSVPDEYAGGIGRDGVHALREFVSGGGTLVTLDSASRLPIEHFEIPVTNVLETGPETGSQAADFYGPGSIIRTVVDVTHPVGFGSEPDGIAWFERSPAFEIAGKARALVSYPRGGRLLLSGWLLGGDTLRGRAAAVEAPLGRGRVILFGFRPQYRAQTWSTFKLLFNALLYAAASRDLPRAEDRR